MQESEHYLIDLVTGLVKEYVQEEDCLIMLAMTMKGLFSFCFTGNHSTVIMLINVSFCTDDAVNQSAARLAHEFGEERTIGNILPDSHSWLKGIANKF